jgi:hypothetical protein
VHAQYASRNFFFSKLADFWYLGVFEHEKSIGASSEKFSLPPIGVPHVKKSIFSTFLYFDSKLADLFRRYPHTYTKRNDTSTLLICRVLKSRVRKRRYAYVRAQKSPIRYFLVLFRPFFKNFPFSSLEVNFIPK